MFFIVFTSRQPKERRPWGLTRLFVGPEGAGVAQGLQRRSAKVLAEHSVLVEYMHSTPLAYNLYVHGLSKFKPDWAKRIATLSLVFMQRFWD